jgi:hypothetical protein
MNKDVIPFIPASFGSFVGLVFTFGVLGIVIHIVQQYHQTWCWQVVMALAGQMPWDRKIRGPRLEVLRSSSDSSPDQPTTKPQRDVENEAG